MLASALLVFYTVHIYYHGILLPTTTILLLHLLLIFALTGRWALWRFAVAGALIGLAILAKANAILLLPALAAWVWFANPERSRRTRWIAVGVMTISAAAAIRSGTQCSGG